MTLKSHYLFRMPMVSAPSRRSRPARIAARMPLLLEFPFQHAYGKAQRLPPNVLQSTSWLAMKERIPAGTRFRQ